MNKNWPTKEKDILIAQQLMENYAREYNRDALGLFELVVNKKARRMDFQIATWVVRLAEHFQAIYGADQGDIVTRRVISRCLINGDTLH